MNNDVLERLRKVVREETNNFSSNYRCHEGAKIFARKLRSLGMDVEVKNGGVIYDTSYFHKKYFEDFFPPSIFEDSSEEEKAGMLKELKVEEKEGRIWVLHSWCELKNGSDSPVVVDWHACLNLSPDCGIENSLIIDKKNNLPHKYIPMGIAIGRLIIFRIFPPYATIVRI